MTSRELEILNIIYRLGGRGSVQAISKETGLSSDYASLIAKGLLNQELIKKTANNVFILTAGGRSLLEQRNGSETKKKTPTLMEVSRSFVSGVEPPSFEPEISFINKGLAAREPVLTEHNLDRGLIIEVADARSIQESIKRLRFSNPVSSKTPQMFTKSSISTSNGAKGRSNNY